MLALSSLQIFSILLFSQTFVSSQESSYCATNNISDLAAAGLDMWLYDSGVDYSIRYRARANGLVATELFDMSYRDLSSIMGLSHHDIELLLLCAAKPYKNFSQTVTLSTAQRFICNVVHQAPMSRRDSLTLVFPFCPRPCEIEDRSQSNQHSPPPADLTTAYTIPDAAALYASRNWVLTTSALRHFYGEQLTGQRRVLKELLWLMRTRAPRRGLVEPLFIYNPRNASLFEDLAREDPETLAAVGPADALGTVEFRGAPARLSHGIVAEPAGALLDMRALASFLRAPVLPYRDFVALSRTTLDELIIVHPDLIGRQRSLRCPAPDPSSEAQADGGAAGATGEAAEAELLGLHWRVRRVRCLPDAGGATVAAALREGEDVLGDGGGGGGTGVVLVTGRLKGGPPAGPVYQWQVPGQGYLRARAALRPRAAVFAHALSYLRAELGALPFLAVHWRRGDRLSIDPALAAVPEAVVARVLETCAAHDLRRVHLMTNCGTAEDVGAVLAGLRAGGVEVAQVGGRAGSGWQDEPRRIAVETAAAALAEHVLVSLSAVSNSVLEERVLLGYGTRSWSHLTPYTYHVAHFERIVETIERELESDPPVDAAVRELEGVGARALECAQEGGPPLAACVRMLEEAVEAVSASLAAPLPQ